MPQVRMLTNAANDRWSANAGQLTKSLSKEECDALIAAGVAEAPQAQKERKVAIQAEAAEAETAQAPAAPETAAATPTRKRR